MVESVNDWSYHRLKTFKNNDNITEGNNLRIIASRSFIKAVVIVAKKYTSCCVLTRRQTLEPTITGIVDLRS